MKTWQFVSFLAVSLLLAGCAEERPWADPLRSTRMTVVVRANGVERVDKPVTITGDFPKALRVYEVDLNEAVIDDAVPFQLDYQQQLTFLMKGTTAPDATRIYQIYLGELPPPPEGQKPREEPKVKRVVTAQDNVMHQGQQSIVVSAESGVYYYHKQGAGFASLIDGETNDWISYKPGGRAAGEFRGIPNIIHPEGGFHPGAETCESRIVTNGPLVAKIKSSCHGGEWEAGWEIYPTFAKMTLIKAPKPYWILYEGTPGGKLDVDGDYWVQSDGTKRPVSEDWQGRLERPRWVYFGDSDVERVLFLAHHADDGDYDQFYQMDGEMTVFGFGREFKCCAKSLDETPAELTIGFVESTDHAEIEKAVKSAYQDLIVSKGQIETRP